MHILIAYSSVEGQTKKIARYVSDIVVAAGHTPHLTDLDDLRMPISLGNIDRVILAGSVHDKRHSKALETFVQAKRKELAERPTLLLSVSLSAAFKEGADEAQDYVAEMEILTGFSPDDVVYVAGAVKPGSYDYFSTQVVEFVVLGDRTYQVGNNDHEFTDWVDIKTRVLNFLSLEANFPTKSEAV